MQKIKLKKCPFCKAEIQEYETNYSEKTGYSLHHFCNYIKNKKITVQVSIYAESLDELVNKWNRKGVK